MQVYLIGEPVPSVHLFPAYFLYWLASMYFLPIAGAADMMCMCVCVFVDILSYYY